MALAYSEVIFEWECDHAHSPELTLALFTAWMRDGGIVGVYDCLQTTPSTFRIRARYKEQW